MSLAYSEQSVYC